MTLLKKSADISQLHSPTMMLTVHRNPQMPSQLDLLINVDTDSNDLNRNPQQVSILNVNNSNFSLIFKGFDTYQNVSSTEKSLSGDVLIKVRRTSTNENEEVLLHNPSVVVQGKGNGDFPLINQVASDIKNQWLDRFSEELSEFTKQISIITGTSSEQFESPPPKQYQSPRSQIPDYEPTAKERFIPNHKHASSPRPIWKSVLLWIVCVLVCSTLIIAGKYFYDKYKEPKNPFLDPDTQAALQQDAAKSRIQQDSTAQNGTNGAESENNIKKETLDEFGLEEGINLNQ